MDAIDLEQAFADAQVAIWGALQEHVIREDRPASKEQVVCYAEEGVKIVLNALGIKNPVPAEHVKIIIEDLEGDMMKVAIHMEPLTPHGETIVHLFGSNADVPPEARS